MTFAKSARMLLLLAWLALAPAQAARHWEGRVTHVSDGDTLWVQALQGGETQKLRLEGVDAPELCQPWGPEAHRALQGWLLGQVVWVMSMGRDTYGRRLSQLRFQGQDVGLWLVMQGHAWSGRFRQRPGRYDEAQRQAQSQRRGLFSQSALVLTPRQFRQRHGACRPPQTGHPG